MDDQHSFRYFDILDYSVFGIMLGLSALIGVYYAFFAKQKQNTTAEYLLGGRKMGIFPIAMSLIASHISGISLIGIPSEMYVYGTQYWVLVISEIGTALLMTFALIPVFYNLEITSTYEYLNRRFSPHVRTMGSLLFILKMILYTPIVIYVPALAFAQVSGFSLDVLIPTVCIVCIFYTTLGGIKAVVWTDTLQMMLMLMGVITVAVLGTQDVGGVKEVWQRSQEGGRIEFFNMSPDPRIRHTFWNMLIGKFVHHTAVCTINQAMVQRCLAMPSLKKAKITIGIFAVGISLLLNLCCYTGLVIYAAFYNCDPQTTGEINKADQLLPYFVMKITSHIPALPGIFVSGVFSAALSTMSTGLNSMCGVILEDFIRPIYKKPITEGQASFIMKVITAILGTIFIVLAFVVDKLGGLIQTSGSLSGITAGTLMGMFTLGMFFPWANTAGALVGGFSGAFLVTWMSVGQQLAVHNKQLSFPKKPISIDGCANISHIENLEEIIPSTISSLAEEPFVLYQISYVYYTLIGTVTVVAIGLFVSCLTGFNDPAKMDSNLFSPAIRPFLTKRLKARLVKHKEEGVLAPITSTQLQPLFNENSNKSNKR